MTDDDATRLQFAELVSGVHAYYRKDCSKFVLELWWNGCQAWELEDVRAILSAHIQDPDRGSFMPMVNDVTRAMRGTTVDRSALAWGHVMQAISSVGAYRDVDFGDPATHVSIHDLGGWPKVCRTELKELGYVQHRFCESYRAHSRRGVADCPLVLAGDRSPDAEYERKGLPPPQAKLVGPRRCADVLLGARQLVEARAVREPLGAIAK